MMLLSKRATDRMKDRQAVWQMEEERQESFKVVTISLYIEHPFWLFICCCLHREWGCTEAPLTRFTISRWVTVIPVKLRATCLHGNLQKQPQLDYRRRLERKLQELWVFCRVKACTSLEGQTFCKSRVSNGEISQPASQYEWIQKKSSGGNRWCQIDVFLCTDQDLATFEQESDDTWRARLTKVLHHFSFKCSFGYHKSTRCFVMSFKHAGKDKVRRLDWSGWVKFMHENYLVRFRIKSLVISHS